MIYGIAWGVSDNYLITGCEDGSVLRWDVEVEEDQYRVHLRWSSTNGALNVTGANIEDVHGLSQLNTQLFKQRGARGEPVHVIREASKKLISMASAVSKLKLSSDSMIQGSFSSFSDPYDDQPETPLELVDDSKDIREQEIAIRIEDDSDIIPKQPILT
ncbi:hypothetical protein BGZ65_006305 [Modicella reniformis]|uniref:Uncharacterized protein n=1 Tax=Modicella reniformis TaxID=1440133 RepID=A0A9P6IZM0_9FUNG|nr:hypothetical protein BGZ65_006305 [Modicella reniformis]